MEHLEDGKNTEEVKDKKLPEPEVTSGTENLAKVENVEIKTYIYGFDELEKAEDLEELLKDESKVKLDGECYIVDDKYSLTPEEYAYFVYDVFKIKERE